ncbi:MAG: glycosyltransferase family 4 protein [Armatimonadota bacterium]
MRILIISQIYPPEMGAAANRMYPIVRQLVAAGHEVRVATGMPNYPAGVVFPQYQRKRTAREERDGALVLRTAYYTAPRNRSQWSQLRSYLSFIPAVLHSGLRAGRADLILVTSPPLFPAAAALALARLWRAKLVFDARDLWPDELITYGGASETSLPVRLIRTLERAVYRRADCVCGTTPSIVETVIERGVPAERAFLLPNGADLETFSPQPRRNPVAEEYPFGDRFVVVYSGLLGIKHGLEAFLEAARKLRHEKEILFFILGNGARKEALEEEVRQSGLDNVLFGGERSVADVPYLLARADLCFAAVRPEPYPKKVVSVKVFEYLACERAVVGALSGESARILQESRGGLVVPPGDAEGIAEAILTLYRDPEKRREMGRLGRQYVEEHYSRSHWATRLEAKLRSLCGPPQPPQAQSDSLPSEA